jgi:hypothetical protein
MEDKFGTKDHIIAPNHLHSYLFQRILDSNDSNSIFGVFLESWEVFSRKDTELLPEETEELILISQTLNDNKDKFKLLKEMIKYPSFVKELHSFLKEMARYEIDLNTLPTQTVIERELKEAFSMIVTIPLLVHTQIDNLKNADVASLQIVNHFYPSIFYKSLVDNWKKIEIRLIDLPLVDKPNYKLYKAQNKRQEYESVAQYLIGENLPLNKVQVVLTQKDDVQLLKQILSRYGIPADLSCFSVSSIIIQKLVKFLEFISNPTSTNLNLLISHHGWNFTSAHLTQYIDYFDLDPIACLSPFNHVEKLELPLLDKNQRENLLVLENEAEKQRQIVCELLEILLSNIDDKSKIVTSFDHLRQDKLVSINMEETKALTKAKLKLELLLNYNVDMETIIYHIQEITKPLTSAKGDLLVTTVNKINFDKNLTIICGLTQTNFPNTPKNNGIISETYLSKISNYPSLEDRINFYFEQTEILYHISPDIIFSYSYGDLEGRRQELSVEIEKRYFSESIAWPLLQVEKYPKTDHYLDKDIAYQLFTKQGVIHGSVSSLELYQTKPYTYFLQRGCGIYTSELFEINAAVFGTIQHTVVRRIVENKLEINKETVLELLNVEFRQIENLFPKQKARIALFQKQVFNNILQKLVDVQEMLDEGLFKPHSFESRIHQQLEVKPYPINLTGFVDRIDTYNEYFRIIDYKSSTQELKEKDFNQGLQLQLLTYALIIEDQLKKHPFGVYYLPLRLNNIKPAYYQFDKELGYLPITDQMLDAFYYTNSNPAGWTMESTNDEALQQRKFFGKLTKKPKNWPELKEQLLKIYSDISSNISAGIIDVENGNANAFSSLNDDYQQKTVSNINGEGAGTNEVE